MLEHGGQEHEGDAPSEPEQPSENATGQEESLNPSTSANAVTSVHFPSAEPALQRSLSAEEKAAVEALPAGSALLIAHSGPNSGARFLLDREMITAGRHPEAEIFLDDVTVSRKHAHFRRAGSGYRVEDAGSLNGTYVNGDRVDSVQLRSGSEVQIGKFRLTYYASAAA